MDHARPPMDVSRLGALGLLLLGACGIPEVVEDRLATRTPHERYREGLEEAGLAGTALGARWIAAADTALREAAAVPVPHREAGFFSAGEPRAVAWRVSVPRGRRLVVEAETRSSGRPRVFLDAFRRSPPAEGEDRAFDHLTSADASATDAADATAASDAAERSATRGPTLHRLTWTAEEDGSVVVRLQPELLRDVAYEVVLRTEPTLAFPVERAGIEAVRSGFGSPRDAGRRRHEGLDIFAPRGTPVLAAAPGRVTRVGRNRLGGRVVWLRADGGPAFYHAHLDTVLARRGARVTAGDTLGLVGNSGNARTTPPHLHFGIYIRGSGAVDPLPFLRPAAPAPPATTVDARELRGRLRTTARVRLRDGPGTERERLALLPLHTVLEPMGATGAWVRVRVPDGRRGWVHGSLVEGAGTPVARSSGPAGGAVRAAPRPDAAPLRIPSGPWSADVLGRAGEYLLVRFDDGLTGWSPAETFLTTGFTG